MQHLLLEWGNRLVASMKEKFSLSETMGLAGHAEAYCSCFWMKAFPGKVERKETRRESGDWYDWSSSAQIHLTRIFPFFLRPSVRVGVLPLATEKCLVNISEVSNLNWTYSKMRTAVPDAGSNPGVPSGRERQLPIKRDASFPSDEVAAREMSRPGSILQPHHLPCTWVWQQPKPTSVM